MLAQVAPGRLSRRRRVTPDPEQVVDGLEREPELDAEAAQRRDGFARRPGEDGADRARAAEQRAGLARLHREAALDVDDRDRLERHVERLPGDHRRGRVGDRGGRALAVEGAPVGPRQPDHERRVEHDLLREGEQGVAHDDGAADAEQGPDRRPVPALGVLVDDIVVDQREVVDELDRHTAGDPDDPLRRDRLGREHGEGRAHALAAVAAGGAALRVRPTEVVLGDRPELGREPVDGGAQGRRDETARAAEHLRDAPCRDHATTSSGSLRTARGELTALSAQDDATTPLRTAPSIVAGQPVSVHEPAR